jgi:hypothetical protein
MEAAATTEARTRRIIEHWKKNRELDAAELAELFNCTVTSVWSAFRTAGDPVEGQFRDSCSESIRELVAAAPEPEGPATYLGLYRLMQRYAPWRNKHRRGGDDAYNRWPGRSSTG